eukprot:Nk52_evm17s153 gene=Nk52_evmTU17s153
MLVFDVVSVALNRWIESNEILFSKFQWKIGSTPLSHPATPFVTMGFYILFCVYMNQRNGSYAGAKSMEQVNKINNDNGRRGRREQREEGSILDGILLSMEFGHNIALSILSLLMAFSIGLFAYLRGEPYFLRDAPAEGTGPRGVLWFWIYMFHTSKYFELMDTVWMALRGRKISFVHGFHHATMLPLCWWGMTEGLIFYWAPDMMNCMIHVIMYFYYALVTLGIKPWWKKHLTKLQIVQFVFGIAYLTTVCMFTNQTRTGIWMSSAGIAEGCIFIYLWMPILRSSRSSKRSSSKSEKHE